MELWTINDAIELTDASPKYTDPIAAEYGDKAAHTWRVTITKYGIAANLAGCTAKARFLRADGSNIPVDATISGNVVTAIFPQEAYAVVGDVGCIMRLLVGTDTITVARRTMRVTRNTSTAIVVPGLTTPGLEQLLSTAGGRIRFSDTLASAYTGMGYTTGVDAKPLNGKAGKLRALIPAGSTAPVGTSANARLQVNGIQTGYRTTIDASDNTDHIGVGYFRNAFGLIEIDLTIVGAGLMVTGFYAFSDGTTRTNGIFTGALISGISAITSLNIYTGNGYTFPIGTTIEYREYA